MQTSEKVVFFCQNSHLHSYTIPLAVRKPLYARIIPVTVSMNVKKVARLIGNSKKMKGWVRL